MAQNVTATDAVLILWVPLVLPTPQQIQGWAPEDIFGSDPVSTVETMMGLDNNLAGGYVPVAKKTTVTLMASSPSNDFFDAWQAAQDANKAAYPANGLLTYPAVGKSYVMTNGFLSAYGFMASARKTLQPRQFTIDWETITGSPVGLAG